MEDTVSCAIIGIEGKLLELVKMGLNGYGESLALRIGVRVRACPDRKGGEVRERPKRVRRRR